VLCSGCGEENDYTNRFCAKCGAELAVAAEVFCWKCGARNNTANLHCVACGKRLLVQDAQKPAPLEPEPASEPAPPAEEPELAGEADAVPGPASLPEPPAPRVGLTLPPIPEPVTGGMSKEAVEADVAEGKGMAWLSYVGILFLIPLLALKDNAFAAFHARQGMALLMYGLVLWLLNLVLGLALDLTAEWIVSLVSVLGYLALVVMGVKNAAYGIYWKAPLGIGYFARLLSRILVAPVPTSRLGTTGRVGREGTAANEDQKEPGK
jgi:uncharacterized membrane protein